MPKSPRRKKSSRPPPAGGGRSTAKGRAQRAGRPDSRAKAPSRRSTSPGAAEPPRTLQYKVVELSTVDEGTLEATINQWVAEGWNLDGVQFAMRESSKRPSMGFVFFTREGAEAELDTDAARERLRRIAHADSAPLQAVPPADAHAAFGAEAEAEAEAESAPVARDVEPFSGEVVEPYYREIDPELLERADTSRIADTDRIWSTSTPTSKRRERAADPWRRLAELAGDDEDNGSGGDV